MLRNQSIFFICVIDFCQFFVSVLWEITVEFSTRLCQYIYLAIFTHVICSSPSCLQKSDGTLLAQFYYADVDLCNVAAELDGFDGRKNPARCAALVAQLRQVSWQFTFITESGIIQYKWMYYSCQIMAHVSRFTDVICESVDV